MKRFLALALVLAACSKPTDDGHGPAPRSSTTHRNDDGPTATRVYVPIAGAPVVGDPRAPATLVVFTDYQCPFCAKAHASVERLRERYRESLRVVTRQRPLGSHPRAREAARAAIAAEPQGRFAAMDETLFASSRELGDVDFETLARDAGLDVNAWRDALASKATDDALAADLSLAEQLDVRGAPTFFVNGRRVEGAQPFESLAAVIDEELHLADTLRDQGVTCDQMYDALSKQPGLALPPPIAANDEAPTGCKGEAHAPVIGEAHEVMNEGAAPTRGAAHAPVTITIFADFECPFSANAEPRIEGLEEKYRGRVRLVFRNQPLPIHEHAKDAARAALAASAQGKFWEFHDALFQHRGLRHGALEGEATSLGLDLTKFRADVTSADVDAKLAADAAEAARLGVTGTPTFFVNGRRVIGAQPTEVFEKLVDEELTAARPGLLSLIEIAENADNLGGRVPIRPSPSRPHARRPRRSVALVPRRVRRR